MSGHDDPLKTLARAIARIEELLERLPLDVAKDVRVRIATIRTLLLDKRPPALVLVGRRGAGKSSIVNALLGAKVAELGHVTAQTGRGRWYDYERDGGAISILDTRGMQEGSAPAEADQAKSAIESIAVELRARGPDLVVFVAKATDVDSAIDGDLDLLEQVYDEVRRAHRGRPPLLVTVTHCDLLEPQSARLPRRGVPDAKDSSAVSPPRQEELDEAQEKLRHVALAESTLSRKIDLRAGLADRRVATLGVSAYMSWRADGSLRADERWRIDDLALALFHHLPDAARAELARVTRARAVQEELASTLIGATAAICAAVAAAPIPIADIVPLTALQAGLVAGIAWIGGRSVDKRGAAEFLTSVGANVGLAYGLREAVRAILKVVAPGGGPVISAAIAFSGTMAIGTAARAYYIRGLSLENARQVFRKHKKKG